MLAIPGGVFLLNLARGIFIHVYLPTGTTKSLLGVVGYADTRNSHLLCAKLILHHAP